MKTKSRIMAALVMLAFGAVPALGGTGMTFLTLGVGGRSLGMGEAYSTGAADPAAMQYNPASLSSIGITMVSLMHRSWIQGTNAEYIAGAFSRSEERRVGKEGRSR